MKDKSRNCYVYWIHLPEHDDILTQGYVGITVRAVSVRFSAHKTFARKCLNIPISNAIRKHGDKLLVDILVVADQEYCRMIENKLRPLPELGWNLSVGGQDNVMTGRKHSESAKERIGKSSYTRMIGKSMPEATKAKISASKLGTIQSEATRAKRSASVAAAWARRKLAATLHNN